MKDTEKKSLGNMVQELSDDDLELVDGGICMGLTTGIAKKAKQKTVYKKSVNGKSNAPKSDDAVARKADYELDDLVLSGSSLDGSFQNC